MKILFEIKIHHDQENDPMCRYDYCGISVWVNNFCVGIYGSYYHHRGFEKAMGFADCLKSLGYVFDIQLTSIANYHIDTPPEYDIQLLRDVLNDK